MKKILSFAVVLMLVLSLVSFPSSAETSIKEWGRQTGSEDLLLEQDGVAMKDEYGTLSVYKWTKEEIDLNNFTCTFKLDQDYYWDGHGGEHDYFYTIQLTNKPTFGNSTGLFMLLMPTSNRSLRIEGQILNTGKLLNPPYVEFGIDTTKEIVMHGKIVNGNHYEISFDNCNEVYNFEIPAEHQFHKDLNGKAYFSFGLSAGGYENENYKITVNSLID